MANWMADYVDDHPLCDHTHAWLCIHASRLPPDEITEQLGLEPDACVSPRNPTASTASTDDLSGVGYEWQYSSKGKVESRDSRRHLDWLLSELEPVAKDLDALQKRSSVTMCIQCEWWSAENNGGPLLWSEQFERMAALNLECSFEIRFSGGNILDPVLSKAHDW